MESVKKLTVALLSPGDVSAERRVVEDIIAGMERWAMKRGFVLVLKQWEKVTRGYYSEGAQEHIQQELQIEDCDLVIGIFGSRYGVVDDPPLSRTAREIQAAIQAKQAKRSPQILVYFAKGPFALDSEDDRAQMEQVQAFKRELQADPAVLYNDYESSQFLIEVLADLLHHLDALTNIGVSHDLYCRITCTPVLVRPEGHTELVGDITLIVQGTFDGTPTADITVTLSTFITSRFDKDGFSDTLITSERSGFQARGRFVRENVLSFDGIRLFKVGSEVNDALVITGIRSHAVFAGADPIGALVELLTGDEPAAGSFREQVTVALGTSPVFFTVSNTPTEIVSVDKGLAASHLSYRALIASFHGAFPASFRTREQESYESALADHGTVFALQFSNLLRECGVYYTAYEIEIQASGQPAPIGRAVAIKTNPNGVPSEQIRATPEFLWAGKIPMIAIPDSGLVCWQFVSPLLPGEHAWVSFGMMFIGPAELLKMASPQVGGTLAPFYSMAAAGMRSSSLPIPRFAPRLKPITISLM